jgi:hypothetical protein
MEKIQELYSMEDIIDSLIKSDPGSDIARVKSTLGTVQTVALVESLAGQNIYLPSLSTLWRQCIVMTIQDELEKLDEDSTQFKSKRLELQSTFNLSKSQVLKILETGTYKTG